MTERRALDRSGLLRVREVATQLAISQAKVFDLLARGTLRGVKIGRALRVTQADLDDYVERLRREADQRSSSST